MSTGVLGENPDPETREIMKSHESHAVMNAKLASMANLKPVASALRPARDFAAGAQKTGYIKKSAEDVF